MPRSKTVPLLCSFDRDAVTVAEASVWLEQAARSKAGATCPCCNQLVRYYCRTINYKMALTAIFLYRTYQVGTYVDIPAFITYLNNMEIMKSREWGRLALWGILADDDAPEPRKGIYKLTDIGYHYVFSSHHVPKKVWTFNDQVVAISPETSGVAAALGKKFDLNEVLNTPLPGAS